MSKAARSVYVFGVYLVVAGAGFLFLPNLVLGTLGVQTTTEVWIRILGIVVSFLGIYYMAAARLGARAYFLVTVWVRSSFLLAMIAFVALDLAPLPLVGFGIVDALGALWTGLSLRAEQA